MNRDRQRRSGGSNWCDRRTVLIIGNYRPALAAARTLKTVGYRIVLGAAPNSTGAERSRFVDEIWTLPAPQFGSEAFHAALAMRLRSDTTVAAIVPMSEQYLNLVDASRERLPKHVLLAAPQRSVLRLCHDKFAWLRFCRSIGIDCPPFDAASSMADLRRVVVRVGYPVVIRPVEAGTRIGKRKAVSLDGPADLDAWLPTWPAGVGELLVQKRFVGDRYNLYFGALGGSIIRELHSRSLRTDRWDGSGQTIEGTVVQPIARHSALLADAVSAMGYTGIGCAQFLHDRATGESCFLEINPRFGASHAFVERAGFEMTKLALELARPHPSPRPLPTPVRPVRFVWTYGDVSGLLFSLRNGDVSFRQALGWAATAVRAALAADVHVTWAWTDPVPTLGIYWDQLWRVIRLRPSSAKADGADGAVPTKA